MRLVGKIFGGLLLLIIVAAAAASMWFWFTPVGVNNYINKVTLQTFLLGSPELLSNIGAIDNTPLDFHSGKLDDYTKEHEEELIARLKKARAGLDKYGPDGLEGQERLSWEITAWFFDDLIRQAEYVYGGYRVNQISGVLVSTPSFLTDTHVIKNEKSVKRYISRLNEFGRVLSEVKARVEDDRAHGVFARARVRNQRVQQRALDRAHRRLEVREILPGPLPFGDRRTDGDRRNADEQGAHEAELKARAEALAERLSARDALRLDASAK